MRLPTGVGFHEAVTTLGYPHHKRPSYRVPTTRPTSGRKIDNLLHHVDVVTACRVIDALVAAEDKGMGVNLEQGPILYEAEVEFLRIPGSLSSLCAATNDAIVAEFARYDLPPISGLRTLITTGALTAGNFDAALGYLLGWVSIGGEDD